MTFTSILSQAFNGQFLDSSDSLRINEIVQMLTARQNYQMLGTKAPQWVDGKKSWMLYTQVPELRSIINRKAKMMSGNKPILRKRNGEIVEKHWLIDLINTPSAIDSWKDIVMKMGIQNDLYSTCFVYSPKFIAGIRKSFVPLNPDSVIVYTNGKKLDQLTIDGLVEKFEFKYDNGEAQPINVEDMIWITSTDGVSMILPETKLKTLEKPLSNLLAAYKKRNVLLENIQSPGILTTTNADAIGALPLDPEEKKRLQRAFWKRNKDEIIVTESSVDWKPLTFPTRDLMLFEEMTADKIELIEAFGLHINMFSQTQGTTYENVKETLKMVYQDTIIPETQSMYDKIMRQLGLSKDYELIADFSHIAVLQKDQKTAADTLLTNANAIEKLEAIGVVLTDEEKKKLLGL